MTNENMTIGTPDTVIGIVGDSNDRNFYDGVKGREGVDYATRIVVPEDRREFDRLVESLMFTIGGVLSQAGKRIGLVLDASAINALGVNVDDIAELISDRVEGTLSVKEVLDPNHLQAMMAEMFAKV
ncbi:MAG: hypothetical protein NTZ25_04180 [Candidatus Peregrinibacteria bacterium]|nr:hypothetical protein [Candidatus Peregrinibacteria bacterium]